MTDLKGKIALVTGASRGLGYAVGRALGARGAHVVAIARTVGGLEELDDEIRAAGGETTLVPLDITDDGGLERLGAAIHGRWGKLDLFVHCAAHAAPMSPAEHASAGDFDKTMAVNGRSPQRLIRVLDPLLKAAEAGEAVFIHDPRPVGARFNAAYGASKAAGAAVFASWADECARRGPRIWQAAPPPMPTALRGRSYPGENQSALKPCADVAEQIVALIGAADRGSVQHLS